jgi:hypothetical protein
MHEKLKVSVVKEKTKKQTQPGPVWVGAWDVMKNMSEKQGEWAAQVYETLKFPTSTAEEKKVKDRIYRFLKTHKKAVGWGIVGLEAAVVAGIAALGYTKLKHNRLSGGFRKKDSLSTKPSTRGEVPSPTPVPAIARIIDSVPAVVQTDADRKAQAILGMLTRAEFHPEVLDKPLMLLHNRILVPNSITPNYIANRFGPLQRAVWATAGQENRKFNGVSLDKIIMSAGFFLGNLYFPKDIPLLTNLVNGIFRMVHKGSNADARMRLAERLMGDTSTPFKAEQAAHALQQHVYDVVMPQNGPEMAKAVFTGWADMGLPELGIASGLRTEDMRPAMRNLYRIHREVPWEPKTSHS